MTRALRMLLALAGGALVLDGAVLMVLGHFNLGTMLPVALGALFLALAVWWAPLARWRHHDRRRQQWWYAGWCGLAAWMLSVAVFWAFLLDAGVSPAEAPPVQAIVVLGAGIQNGQPRPALAARLDTAAALARLQPAALIAVCGGQVWGATDTEAEVMARYLQERHGISPERLVLEKASTSTELNLAWSRPLLQARGVAATAPLALVTSDFHLPRALRIAQRHGFTHMVPVAAPTPLATRYNAWLREYFATLSSWVLREG
ncbi:hypothetical protein ASE39_08505 [Acidovorax sp. Root267]|nr:hypothetical protein ASE39_08505 [Acidovorax sp. Root267]